MNANLTCYNNYVASLKKSLKDGDYLSADLRRLMRADEIEQAQKLAQDVYETSAQATARPNFESVMLAVP
ncbi:MAG: hypothetical protein ACEQSE_12110 [Candidatus Aquirickettsiella gammari]